MKILFVQYTNPGAYPPLEHASRILADKGCDVLVLGIGTAGTEALRLAPHPKVETRSMPPCPRGWRQKLHYLKFGLWALLWILRWRPDWVYVSDPLACPIGLVISFLPGLRVVYHEHDSPVSKAGVRVSGFQRFILWSRGKLARRAEFCVLPNQRRVELLRQSTGTVRPVLCVWNCPQREEAVEKSESRKPGQAGKKFAVFFHGSIVPARLPLTVIHALAQLPENVVLRFAGYATIGNPGYIKMILDEAGRYKLTERVKYLGAIPQRSGLLAECREAGVGLAFMPMQSEDINEQTMAGASNKPFDYLACGVPLLVSDLPEWTEMFVAPGYAKSCRPSEPDTMARALRWFIENPDQARQMGERGRQRILADWNYESQFAGVEKILETAKIPKISES